MSEWDLKILCMGAGYVGGPTMAVIAKQCPKVRFVWEVIADMHFTAWRQFLSKVEIANGRFLFRKWND
jgi:hypothetical protein